MTSPGKGGACPRETLGWLQPADGLLLAAVLLAALGGGVARVGQIQLVQPVMSRLWAWIILGERISTGTAFAFLLLIGSVALTQLTRAHAPS